VLAGGMPVMLLAYCILRGHISRKHEDVKERHLNMQLKVFNLESWQWQRWQ